MLQYTNRPTQKILAKHSQNEHTRHDLSSTLRSPVGLLEVIARMIEHVVMVPGLACTWELFAPQSSALEGLATFSVANHSACDDLPSLARSILDDAPPRFALCGFSLGGYVALEIMRQAPDRVTRLALLDTAAGPELPEQTVRRRRLLKLAIEEGMDRVCDLMMPYLVGTTRWNDPALAATVRRMFSDTGAAAFSRQVQVIMSRPDSRPDLRHIQCPTMILVGRDDMLTPVAAAEEMAAEIPHASFIVLSDCGHLTTLERPAAVSAAMQNWLAKGIAM
ncbi:pimeloyl-ACP methyl ester carboxylesterase [Ochrobactrum sp. 19YEA23]|uniref:alpha/beta fold hydrolase n=1 Tax=Ochrobactrum sp. 19YEA23 TaxID=3039854 RepID=UPI00247AF186|nr:pimeloyl-ACP methyl ester carboxylesterase [Ochrobactrum sp. 19YEA23]